MNEYKFVDEKNYDVIVCGSGPAGLGAALAAKKCGADVVLLEAANLTGGIINAVPWMPVNRLLTEKKRRSYVHQTLVDSIKKYGDVAITPGSEDIINGDGFSCHPEYSELAIYDMLEEKDINYRTHSPVIDAIKEKNKVIGVVVREKRGYVAYYGDVVVDATGDGDVAAAAGCDFTEGREEDGIHMPISLGFAVGGIDKKKFFKWLNENEAQYKEILDDAENKNYYVAAWYSINPGTVPTVIGVNNGAWKGQSLKYNGLNSQCLTKARRNGLKVATDFIRILHDYKVPGAQESYLDKVGNILGVRDTRRIKGEYIQTYEDSQEEQNFYDAVAKKYGYIDGNQIYMGPMASGYSFPYRSLVPQDVDGLILAGRCASMTFMGHCAGKSMGNMMEIGEAAGAAAALCSTNSSIPREIEVSKLIDTLKNQLFVSL